MIIFRPILLKLKNKYSYNLFIQIILVLSGTLIAQKPFSLSYSLNNKKNLPFWQRSNQLGVFEDGLFLFHSNLSGQSLLFNYNFSLFYNPNKKELIFPLAYFSKKIRSYQFIGGRWRDKITNESFLSSGSMILSNNSIPITKISLRTDGDKKIQILNHDFFLKTGISHGWLSKENYITAPLLHEKYLYIKKLFKNKINLSIGLVHEAIWGGETKFNGKQPQKINDYLRVITFRPGSKKALIQEQINTLGNHLGVWDITLSKNYSKYNIKLYFQHPFEDASGAYQHFFDEIKLLRIPYKSFDGLFGIELKNNKSKIFKILLYEYINTMNQSGDEAASDSTYGWDNYYNHYIYQSGWVNHGRVIGNPLFTIGSNVGHYNNSNYIINNRIKSHHIGILGNISKMIKFKILFTYSKNYGTYYDQYRFYNENKIYKFEGGINQLSRLFEFSFEDIWENLDVQISYADDKGQLLDNRSGIFLKFNYDFTNLSYSQ